MNYLDRLVKLANKFEVKLAQEAMQTSQSATEDLFFDGKMSDFVSAISNPNGQTIKILKAYAEGDTGPCSMDLQASAAPGKGAQWMLTIKPDSLKKSVYMAMDAEFKKIVGVSMMEKQKLADAAAKKGGGSGTIKVKGFAFE